MKILFIAHYFQPEPGFFFGLPFAEELTRRGHQVEILTGFPNYPEGKIYPEYRQRWRQIEVINGIRITRVPLYPSHDRSPLKRIISYTSLSCSQALVGLFCRFQADVAYVCQGPATIGLPALLFKYRKKIPFIYHIQDLWPDSLNATGMFHSTSGIKLLHYWCREIYRRAGHIVVITPGMKQILIERGVPADRITLIYNWCDEQHLLADETLKDDFTQKLLAPEYFNILYAGNIGTAQRLDTVIQAAELLRQEKKIRFILVGDGIAKNELEEQVREKRLENVLYHPRVSLEAAGKLLQASNVVLTHLRRDPLFDITIPSKIQAYLASGKPILAAIGHDAGMLVKTAGAGFSIEPEDPSAMAKAALTLSQMTPEELATMGKRGQEFYHRELAFSIGVSHFERLFETVRKK